MVSVGPQTTRIQIEKAQVQEVGGHAAEVQKQIQTSSWWLNYPGSVQMKFYSCNWLIESISFICEE